MEYNVVYISKRRVAKYVLQEEVLLEMEDETDEISDKCGPEVL